MQGKTVSVSGKAEFPLMNKGFVRILLSDDYDYDLLIYETMPLFTDNGVDVFTLKAIETVDIPSSLTFTKVRVEIENAQLTNLVVNISGTKDQTSQIQKVSAVDRIAQLNSNLQAHNALWVAGETSVSQMSYEEKKSLFGGTIPDLQGFEYYVGGIFELQSDNITPSQTPAASSYVSSFDWRNRHGANKPSSPYYNGANGWITPIRDQGVCGGCWAFGAVGPLEAIVNLYYNRKINVNLSEQELISCDNTNSGCNGGFAWRTLQNYIKNNGIIDETTFLYQGANISCSQKPTNSNEKIKITNVNTTLPTNFDEIKRDVIKFPVSIGFRPWGHSLTLIGYKVLQAGDVIFLKTFEGVQNWITIGNNDTRIGQTALLLKNSWG